MSSILYETDSDGNLLRGSRDMLFEKAKNCAEISLGLSFPGYSETIPFSNIILSGDEVICVQPFARSSDLRNSFLSAETPTTPYNIIYLYSSERRHGMLRYSIKNEELSPEFPSKDKYSYYRWFGDEVDCWERIYTSREGELENKKAVTREIQEKGNRVKISFEINGCTYIMRPSIVVFPHDDDIKLKNPDNSLLCVGTYPSVVVGKGVLNDFFRSTFLYRVEFLVDIHGNVSCLVDKVFKVMNSDEDHDHNIIDQFKWKLPVKWYIKK